jgi:hypothetical protein
MPSATAGYQAYRVEEAPINLLLTWSVRSTTITYSGPSRGYKELSSCVVPQGIEQEEKPH